MIYYLDITIFIHWSVNFEIWRLFLVVGLDKQFEIISMIFYVLINIIAFEA